MPELAIALPASSYPSVKAAVHRWEATHSVPIAIDDAALQVSILEWGLPWFRAGAVVVNATGEILMVHEGRVQVAKIKDKALKQKYLSEGCKPNTWVDGDGGWNLPAGRLSLGEDFEFAARREVREESGWQVTIERHLCTRSSDQPSNLYIMPVFLAKPVSGPAEFHTIETRETLEIAWMTVEGIRFLHSHDLLRSPDFVMSSIEAYQRIQH